MLLTFEMSTFICMHQCWTNHPDYPLQEYLLDFIDCCLYIVYMYQWQNQQVLPFVPGWIVPGSIRSLKVTGKAIMFYSMALPSKLCAALHGQSNVCSMCDCNPCRSLDLSVLVEILSGVVSNHGTGPRRNCSVNSRSTLWPMLVMLPKDAPLSSHLADYIL